MRTALITLFSAVLAAMLYVTLAASLERNIVDAGRALWPDAWFRATLADAYFGFLTFFVWVAYKEASWPRRALWFALIMLLGNIAMAGYLLRELVRWAPGEPVAVLLTRRNA